MSPPKRRPRVVEPEDHYFPIRGGLDLTTPPYQIAPGKLLDCYRYETAASGGIKPIDGYERVDGQGVPSLARYQYLVFTDPSVEIPADVEVAGSLSGATGISLISGMSDFGEEVLEDLTGTGVFLLTSGVFETGEELLVASIPVATVQGAYQPNTELSDTHEEHYQWLAVEKLRSKIHKVPGSGPVRGVWKFNGTLYAFRDNLAGTDCVMYQDDPVTGWAIVAGIPALLPGGHYEFENSNFGGSASTIKMYGCDGKNKAFEFDGSTFTQIATGMTVDAPIIIAEHVKHLFLGFPNGSLQHSPPTDPTGVWSVVVDAGELGMGEELGKVLSLPGGVLGIWCKDSIHILYGTGVGTWDLKPHSKLSGGVGWTVQDAGDVIFLNKTGLANFSATNKYGNFKSGTISSSIQPLLDKRKAVSCNSVVVASKNQYRIFFEDGFWITASLSGRQPEFTQAFYDIVVRCISAPKRADDELESIYFGSDDGYIYKMDSGVSLDDKPMTAYVRLPYAHQGHARVKKRYREVVAELDAFGGKDLHLALFPDFSFRNPDSPEHAIVDISESTGNAGLWDVSDWNTFSWYASDVSAGGGGTASGRVDGVSTEMGLILYFNAVNTITPNHVLNGIFTYFNFLGRQK